MQVCSLTKENLLNRQEDESQARIINCIQKTFKNTSEVTAGLRRSANRGRAVSIGGAGSQGVAGDHPHHGDGGLGGALEQVQGLDLADAAATRDQSEGLPRAGGEDGGQGRRRHDDGLGADGRTCDQPLIGSLQSQYFVIPVTK